MPSKKIIFWDLDDLFSSDEGLISLACADSLVYDFFLRPSRKFRGSSPQIYSGKELKLEFLENNLQGPGLFQEPLIWWIHSAEQLSKDCQSRIAEWQPGPGDRVVLLHKKALKTPYDVHMVKPPAFWEGGKFLHYVCQKEKVSLSGVLQEKLLSLYSQSFEKLYLAILQLKGLYGDQHLDSLKYLEHISQSLEMDMFKLADLFNHGNLKNFLLRILSFQNTDELRKICFFFQRHIEKAISPEVLQKKDRLSQYDKGILMAYRNMGQDELNRWLDFFIDLELKTKMSPASIRDDLRLKSFSYFS